MLIRIFWVILATCNILLADDPSTITTTHINLIEMLILPSSPKATATELKQALKKLVSTWCDGLAAIKQQLEDDLLAETLTINISEAESLIKEIGSKQAELYEDYGERPLLVDNGKLNRIALGKLTSAPEDVKDAHQSLVSKLSKVLVLSSLIDDTVQQAYSKSIKAYKALKEDVLCRRNALSELEGLKEVDSIFKALDQRSELFLSTIYTSNTDRISNSFKQVVQSKRVLRQGCVACITVLMAQLLPIIMAFSIKLGLASQRDFDWFWGSYLGATVSSSIIGYCLSQVLPGKVTLTSSLGYAGGVAFNLVLTSRMTHHAARGDMDAILEDLRFFENLLGSVA